MSEKRPRIIAVTGIQAAGKSTVARLLAARFERGVHIEADTLYRMIVAGRVLPEEPGVMPPEAERQLRLRLRNACLLARSFYEGGFSVVIDEIIIGERYDHLQEDLAGLPFDLVVLAPRAEVVGRSGTRDAASAWCSVRSGRPTSIASCARRWPVLGFGSTSAIRRQQRRWTRSCGGSK